MSPLWENGSYCQSLWLKNSSSHTTTDESAVVPISQSSKQPQVEIHPMFQILHLTQMQKRSRLMVDSASPMTFINVKTWQDLEKPKLQSTDRVLGAFEGQPIKPLGSYKFNYFV